MSTLLVYQHVSYMCAGGLYIAG